MYPKLHLYGMSSMNLIQPKKEKASVVIQIYFLTDGMN